MVDVQFIIRIILAVLALAGVWAVIEIALTLRKVRQAVGEATDVLSDVKGSVNTLVTELQPVIGHVDEVVVQATPAVGNIVPVLGNTATTIDTLNSNLERVEDILSDASKLTGAASSASASVARTTSSIAHKVRARLGLGGKKADSAESRQEQGTGPALLESGDASDPSQTTVLDTGASPVGASPAYQEVTVEEADSAPLKINAGYFSYPESDSTSR